MYEVTFTNRFLRNYKQCIKRKYDISLLDNILISLAETGDVTPNHKPHIIINHIYYQANYKDIGNVT